MEHKDIKETAKEVRQALQKQYPDCKWQVRISRFSMGQSMSVALLAAPFKAFAKDTDCNGNPQHGYAQLNHYQFERPAGWKEEHLNNGSYLTPEAWDCMATAHQIANKDNWNNSRPEEDYFDVNYYLDLEIGRWDKPFCSTEPIKESPEKQTKGTRKVEAIPTQAIHADPDQPRKEFGEDALFELAQSIRRNGLLQPIAVRKNADGYIIIAGERRYRAVCILEWPTIDCIIYNGGEKAAKELQLIENINRENLNPIEVALGYQQFLDNGYSLDAISEVVGKPKNIISWLLNVLKAKPEVQAMVSKDQISLVVAISLGKLSVNGQTRALRVMVANAMNVAECQKLCEKIYAEENEIDMFPEVKLTEEEIKARTAVHSAIDKACTALNQVAKIEQENPGITASAIAERLDITKEKLDLMAGAVTKIRRALEVKRVVASC